MRSNKWPLLRRFYCLVFFLLHFHLHLSAQDSLNMIFGQVTAADFNQTLPESAAGSGAVILADIGRTYFETSKNAYFDQETVYKRFLRVKILKTSGYKIGQYEIGLNDSRHKMVESLVEMKGATFNLLNNGVVEKTTLDANTVFEERFTGNYIIKKITMPALQVGSIYDFTYTIRSIFSNVRSWDFQSVVPLGLWSEYEVVFLPNMGYEMKIQGDQQFDIKTRETGKDKSIRYRWVKKNVAPLTSEDNVSSLKNYADKISFQFGSYNLKNDKDYREAWSKISDDFIRANDLNESLELDNPWLDMETENIIGHDTNKERAARLIYQFILNHFTCTNRNAYSARHTLKDIYKNRTGNEAEINLLLIAFLRHVKVLAYPAVLSTRENGLANLEKPLMQDFNYLICIVYESGREITLDASWPNLPFGRLVPECYNGGARILNANNPGLMILSPDSLDETKLTKVFIANGEQSEFSGNISTSFGLDQSYRIREEIRKKSTDEFFKKNIKFDETGIRHSNEGFDSLDNYETPLLMHNDIDLSSLLISDVIYLTPVFGQSFITNPFVANERLYPVEFPYRKDYIYVLSMDIPRGFRVDELPKSARIKLNENQGLFEYIIQQNPDNIQMQVRLKLNRTYFPVEDYASLREFFADVVKKESEQIVFKKITKD